MERHSLLLLFWLAVLAVVVVQCRECDLCLINCAQMETLGFLLRMK